MIGWVAAPVIVSVVGVALNVFCLFICIGWFEVLFILVGEWLVLLVMSVGNGLGRCLGYGLGLGFDDGGCIVDVCFLGLIVVVLISFYGALGFCLFCYIGISMVVVFMCLIRWVVVCYVCLLVWVELF